MKDCTKYNKILDALQELLDNKDIHSISVSEIAQKAGIGKGSIYYYFPSKDAILDALVERNYEKPLETAKELAKRDFSIILESWMEPCQTLEESLRQEEAWASYGVQYLKKLL